LVTAAQKLVKKIPVSVIPKRDLQAQLCVIFSVTGKNILCLGELSTKILAFQFAARSLGRPACLPVPGRLAPANPPVEAFPDFKAQITRGGRSCCKTRTISIALEYYFDLELIFCYK
jgi:hypothetical protein